MDNLHIACIHTHCRQQRTSVRHYHSIWRSDVNNRQKLSIDEHHRRTRETAEGTKEIRIRKDEFDEIVGQLQGMKSLLESMKHDYDTRLKEMQEKIAVLGKENTELKKNTIGTCRGNS